MPAPLSCVDVFTWSVVTFQILANIAGGHLLALTLQFAEGLAFTKMKKSEANFDMHINDLLKDAGIKADYQGSSIYEIDKALKTASKKQTGKPGYPEFVALSGTFPLVFENKPCKQRLAHYSDDGSLLEDVKSIEGYALNGALHYARKIVEQTSFKEVIAFGCAGDKKHHTLKPMYVTPHTYRVLDDVSTFHNFAPEHISDYYRHVILGEALAEEIELEDILKKAKELHEYLRNYGGLGESQKALVVSAILLALREQESGGFSLAELNGDDIETDGEKLYKRLVSSLKRAKVAPEVKLNRVLHQFTIIKDRPQLSEVNPELGKTPIRFFAEYLNENIYRAIITNSSEDFLGRFYGEFVSYSGGDGQSLGVVLTPSHITDLFCDLVDLQSEDVVLDPCCGTAGFLVSSMHRMLKGVSNPAERKHIKTKQLYGFENKEDMFAIATTNMILRGDGQSNLLCTDFFNEEASNTQLFGGGVTVGFMNPPYSQSKGKGTTHLSELNFIRHLLASVVNGGRVAAIVPISTMTGGKSKEDKTIKKSLLKEHTLEGVISVNKETFYGFGTVPCIAVFTAGEPHPSDKLVKFINFEDDGWEVRKHIGLVQTERAKDKKAFMLDCWRGNLTDVASKFMVETTINSTDEWIHSFYYYNDEIPTEDDFMKTIADYLTFEFDMVVHGKGYLFDERNKDA